jgi:hypothetical protein
VFLSTNNGDLWTEASYGLPRYRCIQSLAISETNIFAGIDGGMFLSTNNGISWQMINSGLTNTNITSLAISQTNIFAGTAGGGVFLSSNNGSSWTEVNEGFTNSSVYSLAINETHIFAGTDNSGVWKRPLSEILGTEEINKKNSIALYPNPASDFFTINMGRDYHTNNTVNIYNVNGLLVKTETLKQNQKEINISNLSNGIYMVEIKSENFTGKQKLIIQR